MARLCVRCQANLELDDNFCPYCSAVLEAPGDPFIGFLLHHAGDILIVFFVLFIMTTCLCSSLIWLIMR